MSFLSVVRLAAFRACLIHMMPSPPTRPRPSSTSSPLIRVLVPLLFSPSSSPHLPQIVPMSPPAPWCVPQVCATIAPVSHVSYTSCSTPCTPFLTHDYMIRWTFSCIRTHSLPFHMF